MEDVKSRDSASHHFKQMADNDDQLHQLVQTISDYKYALDESSIVAITNQKGIISYVNQKFCDISKFSKEELIGQDHRIINSGFHSKAFIANLWRTIAHGEIWRGEMKNKAKDGSFYWVDTTIVPFLNDDRKPYQYIAIRSDITQRKLAEENIIESEKKYYNLFMNNPLCMWVVDRLTLKIIDVNDAAIQYYGYRKEEFLSMTKTDLRPEAEKSAYERLMHSGKMSSFDKRIGRHVLKNGRVIDVEIMSHDIVYEGKMARLVYSNDITERIEAEKQLKNLNNELEIGVIKRTEQLQSINEELEAFSYSVSHDLRAPLRAVNGFSKMLAEDYASVLDNEGKRLLNVIQDNALSMGVLIDDLLTFSRLGKKELNKNLVNMKALTETALLEINKTLVHKATILILPLHNAEVDYSLILQVMINLLSNAIKYSSKKEDPNIEISSTVNNDQLIYSVKDNGAGFDMQYVNKLFGVFQRLHGEKEFEGTGVGLAIVKRIITKHDGNVWAIGKKGQGATFYFSLPISKKAQHES